VASLLAFQAITPEFTQREISKRRNTMSEKNEKQTSELSMEKLENVAGGSSYCTTKSNVKTNAIAASDPPTLATATPATPGH
jgi:hypothetical protein